MVWMELEFAYLRAGMTASVLPVRPSPCYSRWQLGYHPLPGRATDERAAPSLARS